ncbi:MAG: hypothetical protein IT434_09890 [Phycisphaerales bacterium]|nr:hypothetical protein [Phycisphaerales bacterium]
MQWSVPLMTSGRLSLRVHVVFVLFVAFELVLSVSGARLGLAHVAAALGALALIVFLREVCRAMAAQSLGAEPMPVVLWPLGSLSSHEVPGPRLARMVVALSGTAIGAALTVTLAGVLLLAGVSQELVFFNPLDPAAVAARIGSTGTLVLWWAYAVTLLATLINLIPIFPLDAGRVIEAAVADRSIRRAGIMLASRVGLVVSLVLFVAAMTASMEHLMGLAVFGGIICWLERRRAEFIAEPARPEWRALGGNRRDLHRDLDPLERLEADLDDLEASDADLEPDLAPLRDEKAANWNPEAQAEAEVDGILAKITRSGLESLSPEERATLDAARERKLRGKNREGDPPNNPRNH